MDERNTYNYERHSRIPIECRQPVNNSTKRVVAIFMGLIVAIIIPASMYAGVLIAKSNMKKESGTTNVVYLQKYAIPSNGTASNEVTDVCSAAASSVVEIVATTKVVLEGGAQVDSVQKCNGLVWFNAQNGYYILTNYHLVCNSSSLTAINSQGKEASVSLMEYDKASDIALLYGTLEGVEPVTIASGAQLAIGQQIVAVANQYASDGIVNSLPEDVDIDGRTMQLIRSSAPMDKDNCGCGLFDMNGCLVGMLSFGDKKDSANGNISYALPVSELETIAASLISDGYVKGRVDLKAVELQMLASGKIVVKNVNDSNSPLQAGDAIVSVDNKNILSVDVWENYLISHNVGDVIHIKFERGGKEMTADYTLPAFEKTK